MHLVSDRWRGNDQNSKPGAKNQTRKPGLKVHRSEHKLRWGRTCYNGSTFHYPPACPIVACISPAWHGHYASLRQNSRCWRSGRDSSVFGSFGLMPKWAYSNHDLSGVCWCCCCRCRCRRRRRLCTAILARWLKLETWFLAHLCTSVPSWCTSNI